MKVAYNMQVQLVSKQINFKQAVDDKFVSNKLRDQKEKPRRIAKNLKPFQILCLYEELKYNLFLIYENRSLLFFNLLVLEIAIVQ